MQQPVIEQPSFEGREPLKCWTYGGDHRRGYFPYQQNVGPKIYNTQDASTMGKVSQSMPIVYAAVENHQADHHTSIIEMEGKLQYKVISILIDHVPIIVISIYKLWRSMDWARSCIKSLGWYN